MAAFEMSSEGLAREIGVDPVSVRAFTKEKRGINYATVKKMADYFTEKGVVFLDEKQHSPSGGAGIRLRDDSL